jgi:hypothetical protein
MLVTSPVRKAVPADESDLMALCRELHEDNAQFTMSDRKVKETMDRAFNGGGAIIGAIGPVGKIEGAILLLIDTFWYTDDWSLHEIFNFVRPQYRKSTFAKDLINFGKRCSDELAIPLAIGVVSNNRTRAKLALYERQLGPPVGGYFLYRPASAGHQAA